jgi:energy-converting hydrogenase Eha subunit F
MQKRTLSILMAVVFILSMTVVAFANPNPTHQRPPIQAERNAPLVPYTLEDTNYCNAYNELLP